MPQPHQSFQLSYTFERLTSTTHSPIINIKTLNGIITSHSMNTAESVMITSYFFVPLLSTLFMLLAGITKMDLVALMKIGPLINDLKLLNK